MKRIGFSFTKNGTTIMTYDYDELKPRQFASFVVQESKPHTIEYKSLGDAIVGHERLVRFHGEPHSMEIQILEKYDEAESQSL